MWMDAGYCKRNRKWQVHYLVPELLRRNYNTGEPLVCPFRHKNEGFRLEDGIRYWTSYWRASWSGLVPFHSSRGWRGERQQKDSSHFSEIFGNGWQSWLTWESILWTTSRLGWMDVGSFPSNSNEWKNGLQKIMLLFLQVWWTYPRWPVRYFIWRIIQTKTILYYGENINC